MYGSKIDHDSEHAFTLLGVALVGALAHPCRGAKRLLDMAEDWPARPLPAETTYHRPVRTCRPLPSNEVDQLVAAYRAGAKVKGLAATFGVSRDTICRHLNQRGVERRNQGLQPQDVPAATELYRQGWSLLRIAEKYDTTDMTVRARLAAAGVQMRPPGRPRKGQVRRLT
jgi:hypothetical protein